MEAETQTLTEREKFIKEELLPNIPKMRRYLGNVDFNTEFNARKRHGQNNWEFDDRDTKTTFKCQLIGEVADATHGTNLKGKGNFKPPKDDPTLRVNDKSNVKNVIVLRKLAGSNVKAEKAFLNQTVPLNNVFEHVGRDDLRHNVIPMNGNCNTWLDTSAASDADNQPLDLIVVSLLKKFDTPTTTNNPKTTRVTERVPLTDEDDENAMKRNTKTAKETLDTPIKVVVGAFYEPSLLPDFSPSEFGLIKNKLLQHDIADINDQLIPAWKLEEGLRPGTVVLISASLHVYNISKATQTGFRRYYQINAEKIKVLAKPLQHESDQAASSFHPQQAPGNAVLDDFTLFMSKKRKDDEPNKSHSTKKNKTQDDEDYQMVEDKT